MKKRGINGICSNKKICEHKEQLTEKKNIGVIKKAISSCPPNT